MSNAALNDSEKTQVVSTFLGILLREMNERDMSSEVYTLVATRAIRTCAAALEQMKNYDKPLNKAEAMVFIEAYSLGTIYSQQQ